jgi:hypothetical protein
MSSSINKSSEASKEKPRQVAMMMMIFCVGMVLAVREGSGVF